MTKTLLSLMLGHKPDVLTMANSNFSREVKNLDIKSKFYCDTSWALVKVLKNASRWDFSEIDNLSLLSSSFLHKILFVFYWVCIYKI